MVRDGYFYAVPLIAAAVLLGWLTAPAWAIIPLILAGFFLWFFRDPERAIPQEEGALVSPGDGTVTDISRVRVGGEEQTRISIFLSVFNVHVNRSPISGIIRDVRYQRGKFLDARSKACADENEQNVVTMVGDGQTVVFKQIAGETNRVSSQDRRQIRTWAAGGSDQVWITRGCAFRFVGAGQCENRRQGKGRRQHPRLFATAA
jgi:phosphatidylserine decarboxylase